MENLKPKEVKHLNADLKPSDDTYLIVEALQQIAQEIRKLRERL